MSKKKRKTGMSPGTVMYVGQKEVTHGNVIVMQYNANEVKEFQLDANHLPKPSNDFITWYDVRGLSDTKLVSEIGACFNIHALALEDIVDPNQRPKTNEFEDGILLIVKSLRLVSAETTSMVSEQVSVYLTHNTIITFQEDEDDLFPQIRNRIQQASSRHRQRGVDYLAYSLIDLIVDGYFIVLDSLDEQIERTEGQIVKYAMAGHKSSIHKMKQELSMMRRAILPERDAVSRFFRSESPHINGANELYLRDLYDHIAQVLDVIEVHRESVIGLQDLYNSEINSRTNNVMQVLTVTSAIFIPLTFIVGVYGMNFDEMPELRLRSGYYVVWSFMIVVATLMLFYFRRKRWI